MSTPETMNYETIRKIVRGWPASQRFTLIQDLLRTLAPPETAERLRRNTLDQALGLLATDRTAPTDAEVAQWLDDRRTERYGR
jgi:hypothetical protein